MSDISYLYIFDNNIDNVFTLKAFQKETGADKLQLIQDFNSEFNRTYTCLGSFKHSLLIDND